VPYFKNEKPTEVQTVVTFDFRIASGVPEVSTRYYAPPESPPIGELVKMGAGVKPPKVLYAPDPGSPSSAHADKIDGKVTLSLVVSREGMPRDIKIAKSLRPDMDEEAIRTVRQWRFAPAIKDGEPVPVAINVQIQFQKLKYP